MSRKAEREEKAILKARGRFPPELLKWVTSPEKEITQDVDRIIDRVVKDRRRRIEVFLTGLAKKYVERAVFFIGRLPDVEEELLDPDRIKTMKNSDLIRLLGVLAEQVEDASEFLRSFVSDEDLRSEPLPSPGAEFTPKEVEAVDVSAEEREAAEALSAESRQRIGGVLKKVLTAIDTVDKGKSPLKLAAPQKPADDEGNETKPKKAKKKKSRGAGK